MKRNNLLPLFLAAFAAFQTAQADSVSVPVPGSDVTPPMDTSKHEIATKPDRIDISLSTWAPFQLNPYSNNTSVSAFSASFPGVSISYISDIFTNACGDFSYRMGAEFRKETRSAPGLSSESLYLGTVRIGGEFAPAKLKSNHFAPYVGFSLMPTIATASNSTSAYDNGISTVDFPVEFDLGAEIPLTSSPNGLRLTFAGQLILGRILGSSLASTGVVGGVRIPL
jgi:hypothetical protein